MKVSVLIIAHNEEKYIGECIESILRQTQKPDEIVLVVHNSTDQTLAIAKRYSIQVISFSGEIGPVYARMEGLRNVSGDIVLSIDGDAVAEKNWVQVMTKELETKILVGSWVKIKGTFFDTLSNFFNKYFCVSKNKKATTWLWGASFTFWGKEKIFVLETFQKSIKLSKELKFSPGRIAEDYWLALFMKNLGEVAITNKTWVTAHAKETSIGRAIGQSIQNHINGHLIRRKFKSLG
jgi:glycosyltransferase involved in cell wall biosynthesis